jgi:hypothetical protein
MNLIRSVAGHRSVLLTLHKVQGVHYRQQVGIRIALH